MSSDWDKRWAAAARIVAQAETDNFAELIKTSGLDPAKHLRFCDWSGIDFSDCDLAGFDFTGAKLLDCKFSRKTRDGAKIRGYIHRTVRAEIAGARFDQALINGSNLREAVDWDAYVRNWRRPAQPVRDDHLPVGAVFQDAPFASEMIVVPPGRFTMGSPEDEPERLASEGPQHEVTIAYPLAVGRYAVTFEEWDFAQDDKDWKRWSGIEARKPEDQGWGRGDRPVINVSWKDAQAYVKWLREKTGKAYRLLSEAEWEYVARAGTTSPFWWGDSITTDQANYDGNFAYNGGGKKGKYRQKTLPVRSFEPNPWGLYQVHGNVREWCEDVWDENYDGALDDSSAGYDGQWSARILRGGAWLIGPQWLRAANRSRGNVGYGSYDIGFRLARTLTS